MERKKEFAVLADALSKTSITKINEVCRLILKERIESIVCSDKEVLRLIENFISGYSPCVEMNVTKREKSHKEPVSRNKKIICGVIGVAGLLTATLYNNNSIVENLQKQSSCDFSLTRLLGCVAFGTAAVMGTFLWQESKEKKDISYNCEIKQTVEDIINELDIVFETIKRLLTHNQLESQYSPIFKWIQNLWAESDKDLQNDIHKLLNRINYELVNYSTELSEYFDANKATDIEEPKTTRPALRNKITGDIVERGYVIIPM